MTFEEYRDRKYFSSLDGLRAICVLGTIALHSPDSRTFGWLGGGLGVTVFFILSGYLITTLALREERENGSISLAAFYVRRSFRILPIYYAVLGGQSLLILTGVAMRSSYDGFVRYLPSYLCYYQDLLLTWDIHNQSLRPTPFTHTWSLGVEEKFYLAWPALCFVLWRARPRSRLVGAAALVVGFAASRSIARLGLENKIWVFWSLVLSNYFPILLGCLLALLLDLPHVYRRLSLLGTGIGTGVIVSAFLTSHLVIPLLVYCPAEYVWWESLLAVGVITSLLTGGGWFARLLEASPLTMLGRLSYSVYLVHAMAQHLVHRLLNPGPGQPMRSIPGYILTCLVSAAAAYILAVTVERPCIALGRGWSRRLIENRERKLEAVPELAEA